MTPASGQEEQAVAAETGADAGTRFGAKWLPGPLELTVGAEWVAPSLVRRRVQAWLEALHWPDAELEELVLAVSEAVSNSVEHGYRVPPDAVGHPEVVAVSGRVVAGPGGARRVELTVRDWGSWRKPASGPSSRGHGMLIMRTCADRFTVEHGPTGTTVELTSRPTPLPLLDWH